MATAKTTKAPKASKKAAPKKATKKVTKATKITKGASKKDSSQEALVQRLAEELLEKVGFVASVAVSPRTEGGYSVQIESEEPSLLIGFHGQTLSALQLILGFAVQKETEQWAPIILNVGDYRERREDQLRHLAQSVAQRVRFSGQPQIITRLNAAERRIVHLTLAEDEMVETVSEGEGLDRQLVVRPKQTVV